MTASIGRIAFLSSMKSPRCEFCKGPAQVLGRIEGEVRASGLQISDGASVSM
jgi:hypothetical protein